MWPSIAITDFGKWISKKCLSNKVCLWGCGVFCGYINDKWLELSEELSSNKGNAVIFKKAVHPMKSVSFHLTCKKDVFLWSILLFYTPTHTLSSSCTQNKKNMSQPLRNNSDFSCFVSPLLVLQILQTESTIRASRDRTLGEVRQDVQPVVYLFLNE